MGKWVVLVILLLVALVMPNPMSTAQSGTQGILTTFGKVDAVPLDEGIHFVRPMVRREHMMDVWLQKTEGKGVAASRDLYQIQIAAALNWRPAAALVADTFQKIGNQDVVASRVIEPAVRKATKAV